MNASLAVVVAADVDGVDLARVIRRAENWADSTGCHSVVVTRRANGLSSTDARVTTVHSPGTVGEAWAAGLAVASGTRALLVDDRHTLTDEELRQHAAQAADTVAVPVVAGLPAAAAQDHLAAAFALRRGRGTSASTEDLRRVVTGDIDDVVGAYRAAALLLDGRRSAPTSPLASETDIDPWQAGFDAIRLYERIPATMEETGLGTFREVPYPAYRARRGLSRVPAVARRLTSSSSTVLQRAARDALFWAGVRDASGGATWDAIRAAVPILMYHGFTAGADASRFVLPRTRLDRQLHLLRLLGRRVISLDDYVEHRRRHRFVPAKSVVLTIDDGYADAYDVAAPVLLRHRASATIFVPSARVGHRNDWSTEVPLAGRPLATADQLREGREMGIAVGAHARTHPALTELAPDDAAAEIGEAQHELSQIVNAPVTTFAYPFGAEDDPVRAMVMDAGYAAACSSRGGPNAPDERLDSLRRIEVRGTDPLWRFVLAILAGSPRPVRAFRQQWGT
jgi:peptidoglycan/xylan/chitin deacetylase (PgdA/CDA1 family)